MKIDLDGEHAGQAYGILSALITPRPIAWVTTVDEAGSVNAAPFSFFNVFGSRPPLVVFAPGNKEPGIPKDTARNIRRSREFVVHMVERQLGQQMVATAAPLDHGVSELDGLGLDLLASDLIDVPRIAQASVAMECREHSVVEVGQNRLVIGTVHCIHVRDGLFDPQTMRFNVDAYAPIGRMASPDWYCGTEDLYEIKR
ncbi:flavin reductase family protein [Persicirhabdus sediminis]|uniref:Flavin reductase family protein n=1 Tax=Persicirhabdus sediminis TaxID=454144 RepID=A0A8J7SLB5_9BACT|nr:flavin reductase family protein [Persicirhabdus sediminis]MBK1792266.1 flavin reductase family protein [Persicirhabdus sediminis]